MKTLLFYLCLGTIMVYQAPLEPLQENSTKEVEFPTTLEIEDVSVQEEMEELFLFADEELERQEQERIRIAEEKRIAEEAEAKRLAEEERIRKRKNSYL